MYVYVHVSLQYILKHIAITYVCQLYLPPESNIGFIRKGLSIKKK